MQYEPTELLSASTASPFREHCRAVRSSRSQLLSAFVEN